MERKQKVHFGYTQAGTPGLFTGNTLAMSLKEEEANEEAARKAAERWGFEFEPKSERKG